MWNTLMAACTGRGHRLRQQPEQDRTARRTEYGVTAIALAKRNGAGRIVGIGETADESELLALGADHYIHDFTEFDYGWLEN